VVTDLLQDRDGTLWAVAEQSQLYWLGRKAWHELKHEPFFVGAHAFGRTSIHEDRLGNFWFVPPLSGSIKSFDRSHWEYPATPDSVSQGGGKHFTAATRDSAGDLWFAIDVGVTRFDGATWASYTTADGLPTNDVLSMATDRAGNVWVGGSEVVGRFDGTSWKTWSAADGIPSTWPFQFAEDDSGYMWFASHLGPVRFDGVRWSLITAPNGECGSFILSMAKDRNGTLWFGGPQTCTFDGSNWVSIYDENGRPRGARWVHADRDGNVWLTGGQCSRWDGTVWTEFDVPGSSFPIAEDDEGRLWVDTTGAVFRYDGTEWAKFIKGEEIGAGNPTEAHPWLCERGGAVWFYGETDLGRYQPDTTPSGTLYISTPPNVTSSSAPTASYVARLGETKGVEFSHRLDSGAWSPWVPVGSWVGSGLTDGDHVLEARSRDESGNIDPFPARTTFTVDATPPAPVITAPPYGAPVRGMTTIAGTVADKRFTSYRVETRPAGMLSWSDATLLRESTTPVGNGHLASWDTTRLPDGLYDLRVSVADSLGLVGFAQVTVLVDNLFPFADQTAPATVSAAAGGDLYTNDAELHLYFPPHAFADDALVSISSLGAAADTVASTAIQASPAYLVAWSAPLAKPATLSFSTQGSLSGTLSVYHSSDGSDWTRLGGTAEPGKLSLAISSPGTYALFTDAGPTPEGAPTLSKISFTPRVFSPAGGFAQDHLAIGFTLGRSSPVTVRVYNRAGRLVREVVSGQRMPPGASLVRWDGRDRAGVPVTDGLYLVSVQAQGLTERKTIAVVR